MRKPLIAGNWKMNLLYSKVPEYFKILAESLKADKPHKAEILLAVPSPFLPLAREAAQSAGFLIAAQTLHEKAEGAYTGEISWPMLKDLDIRWTLVGHSERRQYFGETSQSVAEKAKICCENGITPIVCIGETRAEREAARTEKVLFEQIDPVLAALPAGAEFVFAYEPVWAIGTGLTATNQQAQEAHAYIRQVLKNKLGPAKADSCRILYGGSVKSSLIAGLMEQRDVDGALVGGASLDPREFAKIVVNAG